MKNYLLKILLFSIICFSQLMSAQDTPEEKPQESAEELAKKLANPISSLISVPFQNNTDFGIGPNNGSKNTLNIQPVLPISLNDNLNLITRLILPVISQYNITGQGNSEVGLGDAVLSAFLSPSQSKGGLTWGVGPVFLVPTGTDDFLTTKKFGVGPTAVALYQTNGFTIGGLINQIWSVAGNKDRGDVSTLFFQPFLTYNWKSGAGIGGQFEITQNWEANNTTVWFIPTISAVTSLGTQKTQFSIGPRFNLAAPDSAKADLGVRANIVFLFPK
jgi:hypothetical protein